MTQTTSVPFTKSHTLRWPIADDKGQQLTQVTMRTLSLAQVRDLRKQHDLDDDEPTETQLAAFIAAMIRAASGLTEAERGRLASPDHNSLTLISHDLTRQPSSEYLPTDKGSDQVPLLVPVDDPERGVVESYSLQPPTVKATEIVNAAHSGFEREVQIAAICTDLAPDTIRSLHMPDWVRLQSAVSDFLGETADYFPSPTLSA